MVFDDIFSTVPILRAGTVPSNWEELVVNTREKSADGFYDITKTWFDADQSDPHVLPNTDSASSDLQVTDQASIEVETADGIDLRPYVDKDNPDSAPVIDSIASAPGQDTNLITQDDTMDESTTHDTNDFVNFGGESEMPPMLNLQTAGLRRSPRIAKLKRPWYKCNLIAKCFCAITVAATLQWTPTLSQVYSGAENMVFSAAHSYHSANQLFDDTLNSLHPMALATEKEDNESYTFKQMLQQPDAADFIRAMMKESADHEARSHWTVIPRWQKPPGERTILAIWAF